MAKKSTIDPKVYNALVDKATAALVAPTGPFTIVEEEIRGVKVKCFTKQPKTLPDFYAQQFPLWSHNTFLVFEEERYTFGEVAKSMSILGYELRHTFNVKSGDRVAVAMKNLPEWCISFFAVTSIGAVCVPLNGWWSGPELEYGLSDSGTKVLICDQERFDRAQPYLSKLGIKAILARPTKSVPKDVFNYLDVLAHGRSHGKHLPITRVDPEDNALIMYTSGTTGHPKGVVLTHRSVCAQMAIGLLAEKLTEVLTPPGTPPSPHQPGAVCPVPLFHVTASHHVFLQSLCSGRKLALMTKWDPGHALQLIEKEKITAWTGVPTMIQDLMEHPDFTKRDLSSLKIMSSGGAPNPASQVKRVEEKFPVARPQQGYGLTETNGAVCMIAPDNYLHKPTSTGKPLPIVDVKIVDLDTNRTLGPNEAGELLVKSSLVMKEYWGKPKATDLVLENGWFRTGDVAKVDEEGFVYITDRAKDIIIRGGENISCAEVETAFYHHPSIMECAVFGLPDSRLGEIVGIKIMYKKNVHRPTPKELIEFVSKELAPFKIPKAENFYFTEEPLPRGATGKTLKRVIRESVLKELKIPSKL